ncbi:thrombospondin type-1 domain-containing protein 4-like [Cydia splendana]|uniref:thrombospondin type-1 domain-containing protein 4-like n=1 Tax=Cydia splendana TaxID=1100963 RepID=UPI00300C7517
MMKMERLRMEILWVAAIIQFAMCTTATNDISTSVQTDSGAYAWSAWGAWSPCSRTCGGGVAVQKRECLPRPGSTNTTLPTPTVRVSRQTRGADCVGVARRYHQCNMAPCHTGVASASDMRAEQCSAYDRRPFRGRFYTWVPYIDGDSPCTLNCRPLGKHFYASLALVADGTPCTRPSLRAICVQGSCKVRVKDPLTRLYLLDDINHQYLSLQQKHFYASLSLVADGTPCTRPGLRAICVQGSCKVRV